MNKQEFLKNLEVEIKISKLSPYTLRNYLDFNRQLLEHSKKDPEDVDKDGEDHCADQVRYACMSRPWVTKRLIPRGPLVAEEPTLDELMEEFDRKLKRRHRI